MGQTQIISIAILFFISLSAVASTKASIPGTTEISWHISGMPLALKQAKAQNKPLFVYWGAVWCPPCNVVKTTIFKDAQFIQATKDYIAVYLDGDTEEAQKWGEKLKVMGYPTLMILSPSGKEVLRLAASNSIEDLVSTMTYSKNVWNPITEVLTDALSVKDIDPKKIQSLANYSWSQDKEVNEKAEEYAKKLFQLEQKLDHYAFIKARSLIFMTALSLQLDSLKKEQRLDQQQQNQYRSRVTDILNNPELLKTNIMNFAYGAENLVKYLTRQQKDSLSEERIIFIHLYSQRMREYRHRSNLSFDHYYATFSPFIDFRESFEIKLEDKDKQLLKNYTSKVLPITKDKKAREALVSDASYLLFKYDMKKAAKSMLANEMKTSKNPYYLMSTLGYFEKEEGNSDNALVWYEKAYKAAKGPATKLQWYGSFIRNLIKLNPDNKSAIKSHVNTLLKNYTTMTDSFWGRNYRVLLSVKKSASKWAEKNAELPWIEELKENGLQKCAQSRTDIYKSGCEKFYQEFS